MIETDLPTALPATIRPVRSRFGGVVVHVPANTILPEDDPLPALPRALTVVEAAGPYVSLLGLKFVDLTMARVASRLAERPDGIPFGYVVTPNADHLVRLTHDRRLRAIYLNAAFCVLDSRVVFGLGRLFGLLVPKVVTGSDLVTELLTHHLRMGERITIVGLSPVWLPALVARCGLAHPAHYDPPMGFENDPAVFAATVAFVRDNPARFIFLAVGSPRQEYLAAAISAVDGTTGTGLCIGAALEFLAGARQRAPGFISRLGLEWLFRLVNEPRRLFRRYLINSPVVIGLLVQQRLTGGRSG